MSKQERACIPFRKDTFVDFQLIDTYPSDPLIPRLEQLNSCPLSNSRDGNRFGMPSSIDVFGDSKKIQFESSCSVKSAASENTKWLNC